MRGHREQAANPICRLRINVELVVAHKSLTGFMLMAVDKERNICRLRPYGTYEKAEGIGNCRARMRATGRQMSMPLCNTLS